MTICGAIIWISIQSSIIINISNLCYYFNSNALYILMFLKRWYYYPMVIILWFIHCNYKYKGLKKLLILKGLPIIGFTNVISFLTVKVMLWISKITNYKNKIETKNDDGKITQALS